MSVICMQTESKKKAATIPSELKNRNDGCPDESWSQRMTIRIAAVLTLLLAVVQTSGAGQTLTMGWEPWPPFQKHDSNGIYTGLDLDIVQLVLSGTDHDIHFIKMPWRRAIASIEDGTIDMIAGASKTPERERYSLFSAPYRTETIALYVRKGETKRYTFSNVNELDIHRFNLGITRGYYYGEAINELMKKPEFSAQITQVTKDTQLYKMLLNKRIDGFLGDTINTAASLINERITDKVEIHPMPVHSTDIHVMFSKKRVSHDIAKQFDKILKRVMISKMHKVILDRYLK